VERFINNKSFQKIEAKVTTLSPSPGPALVVRPLWKIRCCRLGPQVTKRPISSFLSEKAFSVFAKSQPHGVHYSFSSKIERNSVLPGALKVYFSKQKSRCDPCFQVIIYSSVENHTVSWLALLLSCCLLHFLISLGDKRGKVGT
jgi:hypothetical protein